MPASGLLSTLGISAAANALDTILIQPTRSISGPGFTIIPDAVFEERHLDELEITQHPVERGSPISDHAFKRPMELMMVLGFSNTVSLAELGSDLIGGNLSDVAFDVTNNKINDAYTNLRTLQDTKALCSVTTKKRTYQNMVVKGLSAITNVETENSLIVEVFFQEVIIVDTQVSAMAPLSQQAQPQKTGDVANTGTKIASTGGNAGPFALPTPPPFIQQ